MPYIYIILFVVIIAAGLCGVINIEYLLAACIIIAGVCYYRRNNIMGNIPPTQAKRHETTPKNDSTSLENFDRYVGITDGPYGINTRQELQGQTYESDLLAKLGPIPSEFSYHDKTLGGVLKEIASIDSRDIMMANNIDGRTTKQIRTETYAPQRASRTMPPVSPHVGHYSDCDSRRVVATYRPGVEDSPSIYTRGSKDFAYAVPGVELDELSYNPTVAGQYQWSDNRFEAFTAQKRERSDVGNLQELYAAGDVQQYISPLSVSSKKNTADNQAKRSGFLGEPGFQVDAVDSKLLPSVAKRPDRDFSLDFFNNYMDIRDLHMQMGATGDNQIFNRMKYVAIQPQVSKDIRARWTTHGLRPFVEEELREQANKIWWENDDLDVYM